MVQPVPRVHPEFRDVDAVPVAWRESGSGELILFLHGLGTTRTGWDEQLADFGRDHHCVAWDMPGYGASPPPNGKLDFAATTTALLGLLDRLGTDRAHVVGLSLGGIHALHLALAAPARVRSLVLSDSSPAFGLDGTSTEEWTSARLAPLDAGSTPAAMAPDVMRTIGGPNLTEAPFRTAVASMSRIDPAGFRAAVHCLPTHDVRDRLAEMAAPTLVVVGEYDEETPRSYSEMLVSGIDDARLEVVLGAGHLTPIEDPATFNRLVRNFLSSLPPN